MIKKDKIKIIIRNLIETKNNKKKFNFFFNLSGPAKKIFDKKNTKINKTIDFAFEKMRSENPEMTKDQIDMARGIAEKMSTPLISSAVQIIGALFIGFIVSLIGGLIVKKSRPE